VQVSAPKPPRARNARRGAWALLLALPFLCEPQVALAQAVRIDAPNVVAISPTLVTSGQPTAAALAQLGAQGFAAVVNLAPPTAPDAVRDEAEIVRRQGLAYTNIPIRFEQPTEADFQAVVVALGKHGGKKVLVHCQVNMRASSMVFLYRVVVGRENPDAAYEAVAQVWSPHGPWKDLIVTVLRRNRIAFQPY
jgi:protein tyrosine phosphatase (PTP) superfamily phosphohydrolase (DUF442 family)